MFYIVSTPIGNLEDITSRALSVLRNADLILCEDTRVTQKLLNYYQISTPTLSYHQHSKIRKQEQILKKLKQNKEIALVSDSGAPGISDPGEKLIDYLLSEISDLKIVPIPGPSAVIAALSISGFSADKFVFLGFPPRKKKRKKFFQGIVNSKYTVAFYESPHRIIKTLKELNLELQTAGCNLQAVICRELTKKFESIYRGDIESVIEQLEEDEIKGEFVVLISKTQNPKHKAQTKHSPQNTKTQITPP